MKRLILAIVASLLLTVTASVAPASAATRIVYVDVPSSLRTSWAVSSAVDFVDLYTASDMRFGKCRTGYKCIIIRSKTVKSSYAAITYGSSTRFSSSTRTTIYLNPQRNYYSWSAKKSIVAHELGHANGINWHSEYCSYSVMYKNVFCSGGKLPPLKFTQPQKQRLRAN